MTIEYDEIPVRLPSGTRAKVLLPRPFTTEDVQYMARFLALYVEDEEPAGAAPAHPGEEKEGGK